MGRLFEVGDYVVVLDGKEIGDPHRVGWGGSMNNFVGNVCLIKECSASIWGTTNVCRLCEDPIHVYDEIWLRKVDKEEMNNNDIDDFLSEYEVI